jgi:hypothetical protein
MFIDFLQFIANLLLAGITLRFIEMKLAGTDVGKALSFAY